MRRLLVVLATLSLLLPTATSADHRPIDACVGQGWFQTEWPLHAFTTVTARWSATLFVGRCATSPTLAMTGVLTGGCAVLSGEGVTDRGHRFDFVAVGMRMVFTGGVVGESPFFPDPLVADNSCLTTGADQFLMGHFVGLLLP